MKNVLRCQNEIFCELMFEFFLNYRQKKSESQFSLKTELATGKNQSKTTLQIYDRY